MYSKCFKLILSVFAVFSLTLFLCVLNSFAGSSGIKVTPSQLNIALAYGSSEYKLDKITVTNTSSEQVTVNFSADSAINVGAYAIPLIFVTTSPLVIPAGQSQDIVYMIYTSGVNIQSTEPIEGKGKININVEGAMANLKTSVLIDLKLVYAKPDIVVEDLIIDPEKPKKNQGFVCKAVVKNLQDNASYSENSCKDTGQFNVKWSINGQEVLKTRHTNLKAGQESKLLAATLDYYTGLKNGDYEIRVEVDTKGEVDEADETNNVFAKIIRVPVVKPNVELPNIKPWQGSNIPIKPISLPGTKK